MSHSLLLATSAAFIVPEQPLWLLLSHQPCPMLKQASKNRVDMADHNLWPKGNVFNKKMINLLIGDKCKNHFSASKLPGSSCSGAKQDLTWARKNSRVHAKKEGKSSGYCFWWRHLHSEYVRMIFLNCSNQRRATKSLAGQQKRPHWAWGEARLTRDMIFFYWVAEADVRRSSVRSSSKSGKFAM